MQKENSLISIIIPTFNRAILIEETLMSIKNQSYTNWECIIIDDGSTDNTELKINQFIKEDIRFKYYKRPLNMIKGPNACRKYGFEKSTGDYIQWFDSDDLMEVDKLKYSIKIIIKKKASCVIHNFNFFRSDSYNNLILNDFDKKRDLKTDFFSGDLVLNFQSILWNRMDVDVAFFKEELEYAEDVFFIGNHLLKSNFKTEYSDKVLTLIRKHEVSLTADFSKRSKKLIHDEVYVREYFWKRSFGTTVKPCLKMYLKSLKYLLYAHVYVTFFRKLGNTFLKVNFNIKLKTIKLSMLALLFMCTKKGLTAYQKVINQLLE